ncbi:MAG TPA: branched-chain amino acid ABC transporter permease [Acidimicrobiia bacterium]|nr:branched-chain amino acid ABC transporter permease [Acidimicrobiia bacterium]
MERILGSRSALVGTALAVVVAALMVAAGHKQALVIGVITGAGYGLVALGLVLIYKSSGVFNFAQGEFGTVAVYTLYGVHDLAGVPLVPAMFAGLAAAAAMGLATERIVIRPLFDSPRVTLLVATAGVSLLAISVELWLGEARLRFIQPALGRLDRVSLFGIQVSDQRLLVLAALVMLAVLLGLFFSRTNLGLAILGVSQEPVATELMGISVRRLSSFTWALTGLLAGIAGMLTAPVVGSFGPGFLTFNALIPAFTAAVLGGMTSLPGAFVGGAIVGVAQSVAVSAFQEVPVLREIPGPGAVMVFVILVAVLAVRPQGLLGKSS